MCARKATCKVNRYEECMSQATPCYTFYLCSLLGLFGFWLLLFGGFFDKLIHTSQISSVTILVSALKLLINASFCKLEEHIATGRNNDITLLFMKIRLAVHSFNVLNLWDV